MPCRGFPTKVIGSDPTLPFSYMPTFDMREIETIEYDFIPEAGHLIPLEQPEECARLTRQYLAQIALD